MANFYDLNPQQQQSSDGKYFDIVLTGFVPDTDYGLVFAWDYEDPELPDSPYSDVFNFTTIPELELLPPHFTSSNLYSKDNMLYISWDGKTNILTDYPAGKFKQVNVWIKGGDFGNTYVKYASSFTKAGTLQVASPKKATYYVKLQAEAYSGQLSEFSDEFSVNVAIGPKPVSNIQTSWVSDDLQVTWSFDPLFKDSNNDNTNSDKFLITFYVNNDSSTFYHPVDKTLTTHKFVLEREKNIGISGIFATQLDIFIQVIDIYGQASTVVEKTSISYTTPLDTPIISASPAQLSYYVSYNSQSGKPFDSIYIYEDTGSGYSQVAQGTSNPLLVKATNTLTRSVKALFYDINSVATGFSNIVSVTPDPLVTLNDSVPNPPTSFSGTSGIDSTGSIGFNGYINFTWVPNSSSSNVRGYRIRFRPYKVSAPYEEWSYVDSPGTATTYRLTGLAVGTTYEIGVASYNEFNKESSSYTTGTNVTVSGTPFIGTNVTTSGYFAANAGSDVGTFKFGYGVETGKRGLRFNDDNYWYIDSNASAAFKLGGDTENYIQWNGSTFIIQGDLRAKKGNFSGNVEIKTGGSLFSGTLNALQTNIVGAGFILNNTGLKFNSSTVSDITTISGTTGKLVTSSATIGGWEVDSSTISKNGITLDSTGKIIANNSAYYIGIKPSATVGDIVLWAGQSATGTDASFKVTAAGKLYASGAIISGDITLDNGSGLSTLINSKANVYRQATKPTGGTYKSGDIWINTSADTTTGNTTYTWSTTVTPNDWVIVQDSAAIWSKAVTADNNAGAAQGTADTANNKAQKFDATSGNLITGLTLSNNSASIYSNKTSYTDTTNGWYLGWKQVSAGTYTPALYLGGSNTYLKYATDTGLEIKGNITATTGTFDGDVSAGSVKIGPTGVRVGTSNGLITIDQNGLNVASGKFSIDTAGNAYFGGTLQAGTILSDGTITGSTLTTTGSGYGRIRISNSDNTIKFLTDTGVASGSIYQFNNGGEFILQHGDKTATGYPSSSGYLTLNPSTISLGYTNSSGYAQHTFSISSSGAFTFMGREVQTIYGAPIGTGLYYMRNIGMGTGSKTTSDTDGYRGDIWIQYS